MSMNKTLLACSAALALAVTAQAHQGSASPSSPAAERAAGSGPAAGAAKKPAAAGVEKTDDQLIRSAMRAAPRRVAEGATIVVADGNGSMRTLREGVNGFTCMPDNPTTPGPDPMCMDKAALEWAQAWMGRTTPPQKVGFMYMLEGGTDASNTDPYADKPSAANNWIKTGPHVMIVGADAAFYDMYPRSATPDTRAPYVMWPGTPYQHLMIPIR